MRKTLVLCGVLAASFCAGPGVAQTGTAEAVWPCPQRRAPTISAAAVWSGPDMAKAGAWDQDFEAAALAQKLASRRTPLEETDALLDDFAAKAGAEKDVRLTHVFAGVLELVNTARDRVISGILRYAQGQERLAKKVRQESEAVADAQEANDPQPKSDAAPSRPDASAPNSDAAAPKTDDAETNLRWDKRIFEERSRSLTYVCETPGLLERRLFDIARRIQERL